VHLSDLNYVKLLSIQFVLFSPKMRLHMIINLAYISLDKNVSMEKKGLVNAHLKLL
jgi:hypothetical protein